MNSSKSPLTFALAGQPNVGKSTVFNMLTGLNQHVGNWPGKTVEQKTGYHKHDGEVIRLVDLPGTYGLTANSEEERIARSFLLCEKPDIVIMIANAATLERNLYLLAELVGMPLRIVLGVNMMDIAKRAGIQVETHVLQAALGIPVVELVASHNQGLSELIEAALNLANHSDAYSPTLPEVSSEHRSLVSEIRNLLIDTDFIYPVDWMAIKLLEGDREITQIVQEKAPAAWEQINLLLQQHEDAYIDVAGGRYEWVVRMVRAAVVKPKAGAISLTDRLDKIATHPLWGFLLFLGVFGIIFWLTYTLALPVVNWLDGKVFPSLLENVRDTLIAAPDWLTSLVVDGLISGAGAVLSLVPVLVVFFAVLGVLEDVGYLTRTAYVMDRYMHWMGLHGRSFFPLCIGLGCNVPGVIGTRIIEERRSRLLTILLVPLIPCSGRMAVIVFLVPAFFGIHASLVTWLLVSGNILMLLLVGITLNKVFLKGMRSAFIMEMPLYHLPNPRTISMYVYHNILEFIKKAGTIILLFSALIWFLAYQPTGKVEESFLANFGHWLEPAGKWIGMEDWRLNVALISSFIAKENTIATLGILYEDGGNRGLAESVAKSITQAAALAFLVMQMIFIPCVATLAAMRQETGSWKWPIFNTVMLLIISISISAIVYHIALMLL